MWAGLEMRNEGKRFRTWESRYFQHRQVIQDLIRKKKSLQVRHSNRPKDTNTRLFSLHRTCSFCWDFHWAHLFLQLRLRKWIPSDALDIHISPFWQVFLFGKLVAGENKLDWREQHHTTFLVRAARFERKRKRNLHFLLLLIVCFPESDWKTAALQIYLWSPLNSMLCLICFSFPAIAFISYFIMW